MSAYAELLGRLYAARRFGVVLGLERMRALLDRLGAPDRELGTVVHVAGTNGKGSTVRMIAALAAAGGARVATYTSPHLSTLRERIAIAGELISEDAIVAAADVVRAQGGDELTFFEQLTAIAFVAIARAQIDVTVLEVGLGGRLDATNVVDAPIAVITGIALDHEAILGATTAEIAAEKAGIIKPRQHVVIARSGDPTVRPVLIAAAERAGAELTLLEWENIDRVPPLGLRGDHQRRNAAAALAALDQLEARGVVHLGDAGRRAALAAVTHPGRCEWLADQRIMLDGAHNPHAAVALAALAEHAPDASTPWDPVLVIGVSADKDVRAILGALRRVTSRVVATRYQQDRAMPVAELAAIAAELGYPVVDSAPDLASALARARARVAETGRPTDGILVTGSLFLVGEARTLLIGAPTDPIAVSDPAATPAGTPPPGR